MKTNSVRLTLARSKKLRASPKREVIQAEDISAGSHVNVVGPGSIHGPARIPEPLICDCDVPIFLEPAEPNEGDVD
jgi:hypothetical protein